MKVDTQELKARLTYHCKTQRQVAQAIGLSENTLNSKLQSSNFKIYEIHKLIKIVPLSNEDVLKIFFAV